MMTETDRAAIATAYGLLWHMDIDRRDRNLLLASEARRTLLDVLYDSERKEGIVAAAARLCSEGR